MSNHTDTINRLVVVAFTTVDGVVEDPDGSWGAATGGWGLRFGPQTFAGDKFRLGTIMQRGALLLGRSTWEVFAQRWPGRSGEFPDAMNGVRKYVASTSLTNVDAWSNSQLLDGDLVTAVGKLRAEGDIAVVGSTSVVQQLAAAGLVDEYRLLVLPTVVGGGQRLFPAGVTADLTLVASDPVEAGILLRYEVRRD